MNKYLTVEDSEVVPFEIMARLSGNSIGVIDKLKLIRLVHKVVYAVKTSEPLLTTGARKWEYGLCYNLNAISTSLKNRFRDSAFYSLYYSGSELYPISKVRMPFIEQRMLKPEDAENRYVDASNLYFEGDLYMGRYGEIRRDMLIDFARAILKDSLIMTKLLDFAIKKGNAANAT